ncbi:MAG TPA: hypothetical protein VH206_01340 [Xanthobacteraceae bacterium]|jgi:hypothetical protein|nr:hypothetical protein [Xanthobacteraceae bacterium]
MSDTVVLSGGGEERKVDVQRNHLFKIKDEIELAEIKGDRRKVNELLGDGLARSCQFLNQLLEIEPLKDVELENKIRAILGKQPQIDGFLRVERELLGRTKLDQRVTDYLMLAPSTLLNAPALSAPAAPPAKWRINLETLGRLVCIEAKAQWGAFRTPSLLKRAIVAGGGRLVMLLNLIPPGIEVPAEIRTISVEAGGWLIGEAAHARLKGFFG